MTSVLVAAASRHGATDEIAEALGRAFRDNGLAADVIRLTDAPEGEARTDPGDYDAVVLGSGVYMGRWLAPARAFVVANNAALKAMPVWAFGSGPVGQRGVSDDPTQGVSALLTPLDPVGYRLFGGRLDPGKLGLAERLLVAVIRVGKEDNRDWAEISAWAEGIAHDLSTRAARSQT